MNRKPALIEALADVRSLRRRILDNQLFQGYSGHARIFGGVIALSGAIVLSQAWVPPLPSAHIFGWGVVCALSGILNLLALATWWKPRGTGVSELRPVVDLIAPFLIGGLLTYALTSQKAYDLLPPVWMWLFGLMNISARHSLPKSMVYIGWYYIIAGTMCFFFLPYTAFTNPLPMGVVFFIGEALGGIAFINLRKKENYE